MLKAVDRDKQIVHIEDASKEETYFCPLCGQRLKQNRGNVRIHHFSHIGKINDKDVSNVLCADKWHYCKSDWHIEWQKRFPKDCQEVVVTNGKEKHFADVLINDIVIEFQHSSISIDEYCTRNKFFIDLGYKVIWIFDLIDKYQTQIVNNKNSYRWNPAPKMFRNLNVKEKNVTVLFQFDSDENNSLALAHISNAYKEFSVFYSKNSCSILSFVDLINTESFFAVKISKVQTQQTQKNGGQPILDIWKSDYNAMVVRNIETQQEMVIYGNEGAIDRNSYGKIIGKYSSKTAYGYVYSPQKYVIKDAEKPVWKLVRNWYSKYGV